MPFSSFLLLLALLVLVALFVGRPLFAPEEYSGDQLEISPWIAERERMLEALAELDADWQMGKVPEEIYAPQRQQLLAKGALALKQLETLAAKPKQASGKIDDSQIETMISDRKAKSKK